MENRKLRQLFADKTKANYIIVILIIVIYLCLFLIPEIKTLFRGFVESAQLKSRITETKKDWANIDVFKERISQLYEKVEYYEKKLPGEKELPAVLKYLSDAAKNMGVRITEIKPLEQDKDKSSVSFYYKVPILLKAECGYHALGRFLNKLESVDRFMKISEIKILAEPQKANIHYVQLTVVTYVMNK